MTTTSMPHTKVGSGDKYPHLGDAYSTDRLDELLEVEEPASSGRDGPLHVRFAIALRSEGELPKRGFHIDPTAHDPEAELSGDLTNTGVRASLLGLSIPKDNEPFPTDSEKKPKPLEVGYSELVAENNDGPYSALLLKLGIELTIIPADGEQGLQLVVDLGADAYLIFCDGSRATLLQLEQVDDRWVVRNLLQ